MARVVVLIPRRPNEWRDRLWDFVRPRVESEVDWPILEGIDDSPQPMNRAAARNRAAKAAGDWDVAVLLDADTVPDFENLRWAVRIAEGGSGLICPQDNFRSLTLEATRNVLRGDVDPEVARVRWVYPQPKSSCIVIGREPWETVGGYDERFTGWGGEDAALYAACQALVGVKRLEGFCHHLYHAKSPEKDPGLADYQDNFALLARYKAARNDPDAMRAILSEPGAPLA